MGWDWVTIVAQSTVICSKCCVFGRPGGVSKNPVIFLHLLEKRKIRVKYCGEWL